MPVTIAGVGFDLDYTLAVPDRERAAILEEAAEAVGAAPIDRADYLRVHREHLARETRAPIFADLVEGEGRAAELARAYRESVNDALVPVDGVEELLAALRERYRVGLLTNGPTAAQRAKLAALGWTDGFDATLVSGELGVGKPDRAAFEALLDALDTAAEETVFVGDDVEADVAGATDAGLHVVQVTFPGGPAPDDRADVHLERAALATGLPAVLASL